MSANAVYTHPVFGDARPHQFEIHLPPPSTDGLIHEKLAGLVEALNSGELESRELVETKREIDRLRAILNPKGTVRRG